MVTKLGHLDDSSHFPQLLLHFLFPLPPLLSHPSSFFFPSFSLFPISSHHPIYQFLSPPAPSSSFSLTSLLLFYLSLNSPALLIPNLPLSSSHLFPVLLPPPTVCSSSSAAAHPRRSQTTATAAGVEGPEGKQDAGVVAQNRKSSPSETGSPLLGNANNPNMADIPERRRTSATPSVSQGLAFFPAVTSLF